MHLFKFSEGYGWRGHFILVRNFYLITLSRTLKPPSCHGDEIMAARVSFEQSSYI